MSEYTGPDWSARKAEPTLLDTMRVAGITDRLTAWVQQASEDHLLRMQLFISDLRPSQAQSLGDEETENDYHFAASAAARYAADNATDLADLVRQLTSIVLKSTPQPEVAETVELPKIDLRDWALNLINQHGLSDKLSYDSGQYGIQELTGDAHSLFDALAKTHAALRAQLKTAEEQTLQAKLERNVADSTAMLRAGEILGSLQRAEAAEQSLATMTAERDEAKRLAKVSEDSYKRCEERLTATVNGMAADWEKDRAELERLKGEMAIASRLLLDAENYDNPQPRYPQPQWNKDQAAFLDRNPVPAPTAETEKPRGGE